MTLQRKPLKRTRMKRKPVPRDWTDALRKITEEEECRECGRSLKQLKAAGLTLEAAHLVGRTFDRLRRGVRYVHPASVIPLCGPATTTSTCHARFDAHTLDLWGSLTDDELGWCIARVGEGQARRRISGRR